MRGLLRYLAMGAILASSVWSMAEEEKSPTPSPPSASGELVGTWTAVRFGGKDIGDHIERMHYVFRTDGTIQCNAFLKGDGNITYEGEYSLKGGKLKLTFPDETTWMQVRVNDGVLRVSDLEIDSWVEFEKRKAE